MSEVSSSEWLLMIPLLSGLAAFVLILILTPFASKMRLLDLPNERKRHREPTPMVGGIAIYLVLMAVLLLVSPPAKLAWMMASATVLVVIGFLDDVFDLGWRSRLAAQLGATCLMIFGSGLYIESLGFNVWGLDQLGWFGIGLTIFAVLCLTNGFNMLDGIDGLASGHVLVVIGSLAVVQLPVELPAAAGAAAAASTAAAKAVRVKRLDYRSIFATQLVLRSRHGSRRP